MAIDLSSLFGELTTPDKLEQIKLIKDQQDLAQYNDPQQPWRLGLARAAQQFANKIDPLSGIPQKIRDTATQNEAILKTAAETYDSKLSDGATPEEAQMAVLGTALSEFSKHGNFDAIQHIAPAYNSLLKLQAEQAKLKQEANKSQAEVTNLTADNARADKALAISARQAAASELTARANATSSRVTALDKGAVQVKVKGDDNVYEAQRDDDGRLYLPLPGGQKEYLQRGEYSVQERSGGGANGIAATNARMAGRIVNAANESSQSIKNIAHLNDGVSIASSGLFGTRAYEGSILNAPLNALANQANSQDAQLYDTAISGLGNSLGTLQKAGLSIPKAQIEQLEKGITQRKGLTYATAMSKMAEARQIFEQAVETALRGKQLSEGERELLEQRLAEVKVAVPYTFIDVVDYTRSKNKDQSLKDFLATKEATGTVNDVEARRAALLKKHGG